MWWFTKDLEFYHLGQFCTALWRFRRKISYFVINQPVECSNLMVKTRDGKSPFLKLECSQATLLYTYFMGGMTKVCKNSPQSVFYICNSDHPPFSGLMVYNTVCTSRGIFADDPLGRLTCTQKLIRIQTFKKMWDINISSKD